MREMIKCWFHKPEHLMRYFLVLLPIVASQVLQRLYPIIDNRYLTGFGSEVLYIHSIQYNFVTFGQFVGLATYMSCLVFWRRKECLSKQGGILVSHLLLGGLFTVVLAVICCIYSSNILSYYKVNQAYLPLATFYLKIGLCNMVLQALYGGLDGMLVGSQQQKFSLYIAALLVIGNIAFDKYALLMSVLPVNSISMLYFPMRIIGISTTVLLITAIGAALILVTRRVKGWGMLPLKEMLPVWWGELGSYLIRGIVPFIYAYQLCFINSSAQFLVTYQLVLHISYLFCFPLIGAMQIAVRDAAIEDNSSNKITSIAPPKWWNVYLYTGMIPSTILLVLGAVGSVPLMKLVYGYIAPASHIPFLALFFMGCLLGQWGNTFTIPLRVAKKSYLITKNFFIAELVVMLGGTQFLIYMNMATPAALGYVTLLFTAAFCFSNLHDVYLLRINNKMGLIYEKIS